MGVIIRYRKILIVLVLLVFVVGITMGAASASHTYHKKGYKFTISNSQYKKIKYVKKHRYDSPSKMAGHKVFFKVKTNKFYNGKRVYAKFETHRSPPCYYVTYDFYVNGYGYIKFGGNF